MNKHKNILARYPYAFVAVVFFIAGSIFLINDSTRVLGLIFLPLAIIFLAFHGTTSNKRGK